MPKQVWTKGKRRKNVHVGTENVQNGQKNGQNEQKIEHNGNENEHYGHRIGQLIGNLISY